MSQTEVIYTELLHPNGGTSEHRYNVSLSPRRSTKKRPPSELYIDGRPSNSQSRKPLFFSPGWMPGTPFNIPTPRLSFSTQYDYNDLSEVFAPNDPAPAVISMEELVGRKKCSFCRVYVWARGIVTLAIIITALLAAALVLRHILEDSHQHPDSFGSDIHVIKVGGGRDTVSHSATRSAHDSATRRGQVTGTPQRIYSMNDDTETTVISEDF